VEGQYKPKTAGVLTFQSAVECHLFPLCKGLFTEMAEMALSGEEGVVTRAQLDPK